ncbi:MAG: cupin domain-containing protein [Erythrobacter sp.]|nr:cupin domain-containing protein [Erythrobacter sp.]
MSAAPIDEDRVKQVKSEWQERGFSFERKTDAPGKVWHWETHEAEQLAMVVSGTLQIEFEDRAVQLEPGVEAHIPTGAWHRASNVSDEPCDWVFGYNR